MHKLSLFLGVLASVTTSLAAVPIPQVQMYKYDGPVNQGSYIVKVRDGVDKAGVMTLIGSLTGGSAKVTHNWNAGFYNAFAGNFGDNVINALLSSLDVEYIAEDGIMSASDFQNNAPWNLARVSTRDKLSDQNPLDLTYTHEYDSLPGDGVDIYVVDTGIYIQHPDFKGRAIWGGAFCLGCSEADGNGHGTHVAGTAGGARFGIAKAANLIAVKVLADDGSGSTAEVITGLGWIVARHASTGRPSIATMSFGGSLSLAMNEAVRGLINNGIHCTVAAGNEGIDAVFTSPASTAQAITVGASDITDSRAGYSNFGTVVDVFAPGSNVTSTWIDGSYVALSGTSMATPAVAGLVAYSLNVIGQDTTPANMSEYISQLATEGALSNIPLLTPNRLVFNGFQSQ